GEAAQGAKGPLSISSDGRYVTFSSSSMLVSNASLSPDIVQIYVRDTVNNKTMLISVNAQTNAAGNALSPSSAISPDASAVFFGTAAAHDLITGYPFNNINHQIVKAGTNFHSSGNGGGGSGGGGNTGGGGNGGGGSAPITLTPHLAITDP